jgi:branched-subunit amino acid transport protein
MPQQLVRKDVTPTWLPRNLQHALQNNGKPVMPAVWAPAVSKEEVALVAKLQNVLCKLLK